MTINQFATKNIDISAKQEALGARDDDDGKLSKATEADNGEG